MKKINENISRNISNYMDSIGIDAAELAKRLGCAPSTVYMWIQGNATPRMDKIDKMCEIFGCERSDLIADRLATPEEIHQKQIDMVFRKKFKELNPEMKLRLLAEMDRLIEMQNKEE